MQKHPSLPNLAYNSSNNNNFLIQKINKDNAWSTDVIDLFAKLIKNHHHSLSNFQVAGTALEASTKVYGLRVDSVFNDAVRMNADLARQSKLKALSD